MALGAAHERPADASDSMAELVKRTSEQTSRLVRSELQLARSEMADKGRKAGRGGGLVAGAGLVALYAVAALLLAAGLALGQFLWPWLAAVVVRAGLLLVAGVLGLVGRRALRKVPPAFPRATRDSVKADIKQIKERAQR